MCNVHKQFTEEFRQEAIRQIVDRSRHVAEVSAALGVSTHSLYAWLKEFKKPVEGLLKCWQLKRKSNAFKLNFVKSP